MGENNLKNRILIVVFALIGAFLAVVTLGSLRQNRFLKKAEDLKREGEQLYEKAQEERHRQAESRRRVEETKNEKLDLDERLKKLKNRMSLLILVMIITTTLLGSRVLCAATVGNAQTQVPDIPGSYQSLAIMYYDLLDQLVVLRDERDEAITIAEGYKKAFESLESEYDSLESSANQLLGVVDDLNKILEKQNHIIQQMSSRRGLGLLGGVVFPLGFSERSTASGLMLGLQWSF